MARRIARACMLATPAWLLATSAALAQGVWLPSWNEGAAKQAIVKFVEATTEATSAQFVPPAQRIATFDQDGTKAGAFTQALYDEAQKNGWIVISMKRDWRQVFSFTK